MAKHRPRFFTNALTGIGVVAVSALSMSTPARAEKIDLVCKFEKFEEHVSIDTDRQSVVVKGSDDVSFGPYAVSISDTFFRWNGRYYNNWDYHYMIDRVTGTTTAKGIYTDEWSTQYSDHSGQCRRATQKF